MNALKGRVKKQLVSLYLFLWQFCLVCTRFLILSVSHLLAVCMMCVTCDDKVHSVCVLGSEVEQVGSRR